MNPESENFEALRRLMALKRHEIPPPGYFDRFSRDVMARIKSGESGGAIGFELSWFQRLLSVFDVKPVVAGVFGTAVCAFLVSGVISSEQIPAVGSVPSTADGPSMATIPVNIPNMSMEEQPLLATNAVANSGSLFDQSPLQTMPVNERFYLPNN